MENQFYWKRLLVWWQRDDITRSHMVDNVVVGAGSVVTRSILTSGIMLVILQEKSAI